MNYKTVITIALALCLCFAVAPVAAVGKYYENKYVATDNTPYTDGCGQLVITTLDKNALIGSEFNLTLVDVGNFTFTNGQRIQKEQFDALTPLALPIELTLDPNGNWDDRIAPGTFSVFLKDGDGGQPEYALVTITEGYSNTVVFQGHAVGSGGAHKIVYTIIKATYGQNLDVTQNVQHVVDSGVTTFFFFDNAQNPGGIFSQGNVLLSQINDPAYGIVKNVYIHYTKDGVDKTINTMEYSQISL